MSERCPTCKRALLPSQTRPPKVSPEDAAIIARDLDAASDGDRKLVAIMYAERFAISRTHVYRITHGLRRSFSNRGRSRAT